MPLKVRGLLFSFLTVTACGAIVSAQQTTTEPTALNTAPLAAPKPAPAPTMQEKLTRIRALIAARSLTPAAFELEKIKKEYSDEALQSVVRVMLVNIYLEQPDYVRVNALLEETFTRSKNRRNGVENVYLPVAGQVIKGAEEQLVRYRKLGLNHSDPKLPAEAAADLDKWRKMLETIAEQAKELGKDEKKSAESLAILEEAVAARSLLARDEYEASAWRNTVEDTRELIAASQTKVTDVDGATVDMKNVAELKLPTEIKPITVPPANTVAQNTAPTTSPVFTPVKTAVEEKTTQPNGGPSAEPSNKTLSIVNSPAKEEQPKFEKADLKVAENNGLMEVGSLVDSATRKFPATYPPLAKNARVTGIVKVEVVVDEQGTVTDAKATDGPEMLKRAAMDAVKRWKFKPATKDGQPVRMSGFVNFNFTL